MKYRPRTLIHEPASSALAICVILHIEIWDRLPAFAYIACDFLEHFRHSMFPSGLSYIIYRMDYWQVNTQVSPFPVWGEKTTRANCSMNTFDPNHRRWSTRIRGGTIRRLLRLWLPSFFRVSYFLSLQKVLICRRLRFFVFRFPMSCLASSPACSSYSLFL